MYPIVDCDLTPTLVRRSARGRDFILNKAEMAWFWDHYVPDEAERDAPVRVADPGLEPRRAPAAYIVIAHHDPLRDEGLAYAAALEAAACR